MHSSSHFLTYNQASAYVKMVAYSQGIKLEEPDTWERVHRPFNASLNDTTGLEPSLIDAGRTLQLALREEKIHVSHYEAAKFHEVFGSPRDREGAIDFVNKAVGFLKSAGIENSDRFPTVSDGLMRCFFNFQDFTPTPRSDGFEWSKYLKIDCHLSRDFGTVIKTAAWDDLSKEQKAEILTYLFDNFKDFYNGNLCVAGEHAQDIGQDYLWDGRTYNISAFLWSDNVNEKMVNTPLWYKAITPIGRLDVLKDILNDLMKITEEEDIPANPILEIIAQQRQLPSLSG